MLTAGQIMTPGVVTIRPEATLHDAIELMLQRRVSGLPVVDENQALVGIITEFALLALAYDKALQHQTVAQHMTRDVIAVSADDTVNRLADLFILHRVRRAPVIRDGRLAGLVARRDVLEALAQDAPVCTA